jgi:hypothetical protein
MALAMIYPEPGERGRGKKSEVLKSAETAGFSSRRLNDARSVLAFSRPMAEAVLKGVDSLDQARNVLAPRPFLNVFASFSCHFRATLHSF